MNERDARLLGDVNKEKGTGPRSGSAEPQGRGESNETKLFHVGWKQAEGSAAATVASGGIGRYQTLVVEISHPSG
jgi:hypothetical protein